MKHIKKYGVLPHTQKKTKYNTQRNRARRLERNNTLFNSVVYLPISVPYNIVRYTIKYIRALLYVRINTKHTPIYKIKTLFVTIK